MRTRALCIAVVAGLAGCSNFLWRSRDSGRPIPSDPTPLTVAAPAGAGGGVFDGVASVIFDVFPGPAAAKLHVSRYSAAGWSPAVPAIAGFDAWHAGAQVSPDGTKLYFESTRRDSTVAGREDSDLWVAERTGDRWSNAQPVGPPFDTPHNEHGVTISSRATICINSNRAGVTAGHDILCARRVAAQWETPVPLPSAVNGPSADIAPFIDPDERFLLFASNRSGGAGAFDLYVSVNRNGEWQRAQRLDSTVNTVASESNPAVSRDGQRLLFSRAVGQRVVLHEVRFNPAWLESPR